MIFQLKNKRGSVVIFKVLRESLPVLILLAVFELFAGGLLSSMSTILETMPGLLVIIPALIDMRGNISGALGSRLGSAVHLGLIDLKHIFNPELRENVRASILLSAMISLFAGIFGWLTCALFGINPQPLKIIATIFIAGTFAGLVLAAVTVLIVIVALKKKLDPDNIVSPALATVGDAVTLLILFGTVAFLGGLWQ